MPAGGDCCSICSVARLREHRCQCRKPPAIAIATRIGAPAGAASAHGAGRQTCVPGFFLAAFCNRATHSGTPCARLPKKLHLRLNGCFGKKSAQHRQPQVETLHETRQADVHDSMSRTASRAAPVRVQNYVSLVTGRTIIQAIITIPYAFCPETRRERWRRALTIRESHIQLYMYAKLTQSAWSHAIHALYGYTCLPILNPGAAAYAEA